MKKIITLCLLLFPVIFNAQIFSEGFEDVSSLTGWDIVNVSEPEGYYTWQQGKGSSGLGSQSGTPTSYIANNANSTKDTGTISNWLILPVLSLKDGDKISFYTKAADQTQHPDRLEVRLSTNGVNSIAPSSSADVGDYNTLLLEINPTLATNVYPTTYTKFEITLSGISTTATETRIAFRYHVTNGGPTGANSNGVAIDNLEIVSNTLNHQTNDTKHIRHAYNTNSKLLILESNSSKLDKIEIYNITGKTVMNIKLSAPHEKLNMSHLTNGIYVAKLITENNLKTFKFLKY